MKKQKAIFAVLAVLFAATACQKEFSFQDEPVAKETVPAEFTIEASVDVNDTRAFLDETGDIFWNEGDALAVFQGSKAEPYLFVTEEEGLSCSFTYQGELKAEDGDFLALYPYNAEARQSSTGVITTVLPCEQTAAAGTFGKDANLAVAYAPFRQPMSFKNAAAYAKVSFKTTDQNAAVTKITIRSVDESILLSGRPSWTMPSRMSQPLSRTASLTPPSSLLPARPSPRTPTTTSSSPPQPLPAATALNSPPPTASPSPRTTPAPPTTPPASSATTSPRWGRRIWTNMKRP